MQPDSSTVLAYCFGPWRLVAGDRILELDGQRVQLTPKVIDTLFVLIENAGHVVTKESLMQQVWPDVTVVDSGLTRNMSVLRKALRVPGSEDGNAIIETIPRRGYRFLADVRVECVASPEPAAPPQPVRVRMPLWRQLAATLGLILSGILSRGGH